MSNYFVLDFKKIKSKETFKNVIVGHNFRSRDYKNKENIDTTKTKNNIILTPLKFESEDELLTYAKANLKKGKRQIRANSAKSFSLVIDCSVRKDWNESNYIEYLKYANKWLNNYFSKKYGLINLGSIIHMDESKPHLHISFSYFSIIDGAWIQKKLSQNKATDFNNLLKKFEQEVGSKYGLKKGDNAKLTKQLSINAAKIFNNKIETYKVKKGFLKTQEIKAISENNLNKCLNTYKTKIIKKIPEIGENERLKTELIKKNKEIEKIKEITKEEIEARYKQQIANLTEALNNNLEQELMQQVNKQAVHIKKLEEAYKTQILELQNKNTIIQQLQAKIKELTPKSKNKNKDFGGIGF